MLDNEASQILFDYLNKNLIAIQLAPPHMHQQNLAECAIRTFKEHLISIRVGYDPNFPKNLWDHLIFQAVITLNLLRPSRIYPKLSAYACIFGQFDYNHAPMAPLGTKVLVHEKPKQRGSWADHGVVGWYIGPALNHYRCYLCYIPSTNGVHVSNTVEFFPHAAPMPRLSSRPSKPSPTLSTHCAILVRTHHSQHLDPSTPLLSNSLQTYSTPVTRSPCHQSKPHHPRHQQLRGCPHQQKHQSLHNDKLQAPPQTPQAFPLFPTTNTVTTKTATMIAAGEEPIMSAMTWFNNMPMRSHQLFTNKTSCRASSTPLPALTWSMKTSSPTLQPDEHGNTVQQTNLDD